MRNGASRRSTAFTGMNDKRATVMLLELTQKDTEKGGSKTGKLYLVDLAGSEKVSKTGAEGAYTALGPPPHTHTHTHTRARHRTRKRSGIKIIPGLPAALRWHHSVVCCPWR